MSAWRGYPMVGLGSALGSGLRFAVSLGMQRWLGGAFPWGTLAVNLAGCWLIAAFAALAADRLAGRVARWEPFLVVGFCGGFTTFSLFGLETFHLLDTGRPGLALLYGAGSVPLWLGAAWWGHRVGRVIR